MPRNFRPLRKDNRRSCCAWAEIARPLAVLGRDQSVASFYFSPLRPAAISGPAGSLTTQIVRCCPFCGHVQAKGPGNTSSNGTGGIAEFAVKIPNSRWAARTVVISRSSQGSRIPEIARHCTSPTCSVGSVADGDSYGSRPLIRAARGLPPLVGTYDRKWTDIFQDPGTRSRSRCQELKVEVCSAGGAEGNVHRSECLRSICQCQ